MNPLGVILVTLTSVVAGTSACFWLLHQARDADTTVWILEHILCPILRILVLLIVVSQIYPSLQGNGSGLDFWRVLLRQGQFNDLVNILFFAGLGMAFVPWINHPAIALPLQALFTVALVFHWQFPEWQTGVSLWPTMATLLKIAGFMLFAWLLVRALGPRAGRLLDRRYAVEGSTVLVADALYLWLQIPVILVYTAYLNAQVATITG